MATPRLEELMKLMNLSKWQVRQLIEDAAGGEHKLTEEAFVRNLVPITCAVVGMRDMYESRQPGDTAATSYKDCWRQMDQASTLDEFLHAP